MIEKGIKAVSYGGGVNWNPWHGCHKISAGCQNCYVYRSDAKHGKNASEVVKTSSFYLPIAHARDGSYKIPSGSFIWTCFTSDFLLADADVWRKEAWRMMQERSDCEFLFITKRITRFAECLPEDWGDGYPNVTICSTVENQAKADERLPVFRDAPIRHKMIVCEPLLERLAEAFALDRAVAGAVLAATQAGSGAAESVFPAAISACNAMRRSAQPAACQVSNGPCAQPKPQRIA